MTDIIQRFNLHKIWDFKGGIHPPEMKSQSNRYPIRPIKCGTDFYVPVKQHAGGAGHLTVNVGDYVQKGQPLTQGNGLRVLPVHAPTSGTVVAISPYVAAHPSGLPELSVHIRADGLDQWRERRPLDDFLRLSADELIGKIYQAGVAGLGGAVFPTAAKIDSAQKKVKLLIINGAECEPYITCDDRLMRDYAQEIIEGVRILRYILRPEKAVIAIEDNKPEAVSALKKALCGANDIDIRVIPTKYPSGAAKQLIYLLTGMEVPAGQRSSTIGVLMHNVGTAFAVKRAVIDDEPLIERVVTLTGDKIPHKGNYWIRLGTPIHQVLQQTGYHFDDRFPVFAGGPMMGFILPDLTAPITKLTNCLLAPDHFEYEPPKPEQACIRCSACSDACPVNLMPQELYRFARSDDHQKSEQYALKECIECGLCAYVCPSHIPLIQYFRQEKAKIWELKEKARKSDEAKRRFEAKQQRMAQEEAARKARTEQAAAARRTEIAKQQGEDPVQAALARLKAKQTAQTAATNAADTLPTTAHPLQADRLAQTDNAPNNAALMAQRQARRLARQQAAAEKTTTDKITTTPPTQAATENTPTAKTAEKPTALDAKKAAVAAAIARAKAKKQTQQGTQSETTANEAANHSAQPEINAADTENIPTAKTAEKPTALDAKKAAVAAAIARAKAKKQAQQGTQSETAANEAANRSAQPEINAANTENTPIAKTAEKPTALDAKKAAIAAAIARAKTKKQAQQSTQSETATNEAANRSAQPEINAANTENTPIAKTAEKPTALDAKKAAVAAAIARANAKKQAQQGTQSETAANEAANRSAQPEINAANTENTSIAKTAEKPIALDAKKAAVAAAIARAKAKKLAQQGTQSETAANEAANRSAQPEISTTNTANSRHQTNTEAAETVMANPSFQANTENSPIAKTGEKPTALDAKKAAVAAAIARAKAKKLAQQSTQSETTANEAANRSAHPEINATDTANSPLQADMENTPITKTAEKPTALDAKKAAVAAAIARAKAKKQARQAAADAQKSGVEDV